MADEDNPTNQKPDTKQTDPDGTKNGIIEGGLGTTQQPDPKDTGDTPYDPPKATIAVRLWHALWRKRIIFHHGGPNWAEISVVILTGGILLVGAVQATIYWEQAQTMQLSLNQTQQTIALNMGQVAIAGRNTALAEGTLAETKKEGTTTREALTSVQRAFVLPGQIESLVKGSKGAQSVEFSAHWDNSGVTPTMGVGHVSFRWDVNPLPDKFSFPDLWGNQPHTNIPFIIGPKGSATMIAGPITDQIIQGALSQPPLFHLYIWGWARYRDVFIGTPEHLTKFCVEMKPIKTRISTDFDLGDVAYRVETCSQHNCYDEYCKAN
jgi:hypothetical protein